MCRVFINVIFFFIVGDPAKSCTNMTSSCPANELQWKEKNKISNCATGLTYICLLDDLHRLVETCMVDENIANGTLNCPVITCTNDQPGLLLHTNFKECPVRKQGCPQRNHGGYFLHEIYKYPPCLLQTEELSTERNSLNGTQTGSKHTPLVSIPGVISGVFFFIILVFILVYVRYKRHSEGEKVIDTEHSASSPKSEVGVPNQRFAYDSQRPNLTPYCKDTELQMYTAAAERYKMNESDMNEYTRERDGYSIKLHHYSISGHAEDQYSESNVRLYDETRMNNPRQDNYDSCNEDQNSDQINSEVHVGCLKYADDTTKDVLENTINDSLYVSPEKAEKMVLSVLESTGHVVVTGHRGSGKAMLSQRCLVRISNRRGLIPKIVNSVDDLCIFLAKNHKPRHQYCLFLKSIFGRDSLDDKVQDKFLNYNDVLLSKVRKGWMIILTIRDYLFYEENHRLLRFDFFRNECVINISDKQFRLTEGEKREILSNYIKKFGIKLPSTDIDRIASSPHLDFPLRCSEIFSRSEGGNIKDKHVNGFIFCGRHSMEQMDKMKSTDRNKYCALVALTLLLNEENEQYTVPKKSESLQSLLSSLDECLQATVYDINGFTYSLSTMDKLYVERENDDTYRFRSNAFKDAALLTFCEKHVKEFIDIAPLHTLKQCTFSGKDRNKCIYIPDTFREAYIFSLRKKALIDDICLLRGHYMRKENSFILELLKEIQNSSKSNEMNLKRVYASFLENAGDDQVISEVLILEVIKKMEFEYYRDYLATFVEKNWVNVLKEVCRHEKCLHHIQEMKRPNCVLLAAASNAKECVQFLREKKEIQLVELHDNKTFLHFCVDNNWIDMLPKSIENAEVFRVGYPILRYAVHKQNRESITIALLKLANKNKEARSLIDNDLTADCSRLHRSRILEFLKTARSELQEDRLSQQSVRSSTISTQSSIPPPPDYPKRRGRWTFWNNDT